VRSAPESSVVDGSTQKLSIMFMSAVPEVQVGRGHHWSAFTRQAVVHHVKNLHSSVDDIISHVFMGQRPDPGYMRRKVAEIVRMGDAELQTYVLGQDH
jgi:hypothetical protein